MISLKVEHGRVFTDLRAIVIAEVHAFASDDRIRAVLRLDIKAHAAGLDVAASPADPPRCPDLSGATAGHPVIRAPRWAVA